jgi:YbbR domain-containing protein
MWNWLRRLFLENTVYKLVSIGLAIGLWLAVARDPVAEVQMRVPIEFRNLPDNLEIDSASFTEAQIRLRGPERVLHSMSPGDVRAEVDLSNVQPGEKTFDLTARHVSVPDDVHVEQIIPGQFHLSFDKRATRTVEVRPRVIGTFANGMRVGQVISDPSTITVAGPQGHLQNMESVSTDPVDATGTMNRAAFMTQAYVGDALVQVVHPRPIRVTVIMEGPADSKKTP